jgi:hypothetical protein
VWLAEHPEFRAGDEETARRRWLAEFPTLAHSPFGRAIEDGRNESDPGERPRVVRLADFFTSAMFRTAAPGFRARWVDLGDR